MELTNRQVFIVAYLLNNTDGVSAELLAAQAEISLRTLQTEIKELNSILPGHARIDMPGKGKYCAVGFTEEDREAVAAEILDRHTLHMPEKRVNDIMACLLFQRDYISMEAVANMLFLSKAAVYRVLESSSILKKNVTVSRTRGLCIDLPEFERRQLLTKTFDKDSARFYAPGWDTEFSYLDNLTRSFLPKLFLAHEYHVSGESLRSFRRYLVLTILRSRHGYPLEPIDRGLPISSLMRDILNALRAVTGTTLSASEEQDMQAKLNELPALSYRLPEHRRSWQTELTPAYLAFVSILKERYGIELTLTEEEMYRFLVHVHKLKQRVAVGHYISNYHKRAINQTYPLSVQLILLCFEPCFGFAVPESEVTFLAMYLAEKLRYRPKKITCLIVTSRHPSIAYSVQEWVEEHFSRFIEKVSILEHYAAGKSEYASDMLVLTTGEEYAITHPDVIFVRPFALDGAYELIDARIQTIREAIREQDLTDVLRDCVEDTFACPAERQTLPELLTACFPGEDFPWDYEFVTECDALLIPRVHAGSGANRIRILRPEPFLLHRNSELHRVILSDYYTENNNMIGFYRCLAELLREDRR